MRLLPKLAGPVLVLTVLSQAQTLTSEYIRLNGRVISSIHSPLQALSDVLPGVPYFELAHVMLEKGITTGCSAGSPPPYCPADPVTRGQMAAFIIRSIYSALKGDREAFTCFNPSSPGTQVSCDSISPYFNDVLPGNVFYRYVQKLYQLGITAGCQTTSYCVNDPIANGALAVFAVRARQIVQKNCATSVGANANQLNRDACDATFSPTGPPSYLDVPTSHLWYKHIQYAREQSIIVSEQVQTCTAGPGYFCPEILAAPNNGTSTRAYMTYYVVNHREAWFSERFAGIIAAGGGKSIRSSALRKEVLWVREGKEPRR